MQMHYCVQLNLSTVATLGTESGHCREVAINAGSTVFIISLTLLWQKPIALGITASILQEKFFLATSQCYIVNSVF